MCAMKSTTVREAQHNFAALLRLVQRGEEIHVFKRKVPVARILPMERSLPKHGKVDWSDMKSRWAELWKGSPPSGLSSDRVLDDLRGER